MMTSFSVAGLSVRPATTHDAGELCALLNEIIDIGGTTAYQSRLDETQFAAEFLSGAGCICCHVANAPDAAGGLPLAFQALVRSKQLGDGWAAIATFARADSRARGVGRRLFDVTVACARRAGVQAIDATIRADNASGLGYYSRLGFEDYRVESAVPLCDGTPVDRVSKVLRIDE